MFLDVFAGKMDKLDELLPGIEDFLVSVLANENLSPKAEEKRLYFVERLDILQLPPSLPPRPGRKLISDFREAEPEPEPELETEIDGQLVPDVGEEDFAAYQRELSRTLGASTIPHSHTSDSESEQGVKVYDDIDPTESNDNEDHDEQDLYEIPVARLQQSEESATGSQPADGSSLATAASIDDLSEEAVETVVPPPLPPRRERTASEITTHSSSGTVDEKLPDLPARPPLPPRSEVYALSERSDKSQKSDDLSDGGSTSYESYDDEGQNNDADLLSKLNIKLPKRAKKKSNKLKKLSKTHSSSWEINQPFKSLEDIALSGDLQYKGKLSWNRKLVALTSGNLVCYKPEKPDARPNLVIQLTGYEAAWQERENRKGYEIKLSHTSCDSHQFSVDFKEWAQLWCEYINNMAKGLPSPGPHHHLARSFSGGDPSYSGSKVSLSDSTIDGMSTLNSSSTLNNSRKIPSSKSTTVSRWDWKTIFYNWAFPLDQFILGFRSGDLTASNSNLSTTSDGMDDGRRTKVRGNKVMRMGSFAYRATQFFESLGKKGGKRKVAGLSANLDNGQEASILEERSLSSTSSGLPVLTPSSDISFPTFDDSSSLGTKDALPSNVKHEGQLNIFSSFNKRRWGKRYCLIRENMFECYKNDKAKMCELNFLLKNCILRRAVEETNCEFALMLLENGREKITVEPLNKVEMGPWVRVLMDETTTNTIPEGLEEYFTEDNHSDDVHADTSEFSDLLGYSVIKSWELASESISNDDNEVVNSDQIPETNGDSTLKTLQNSADDSSFVSGDLYSEVKKQGDNSSSCSDVLVSSSLGVGHLPGIAENISVYSEQKHTTDSGFYSVRGSNSDSESDSGCVIKSEDDSRCIDSCSPTKPESKLETPSDSKTNSLEITSVDAKTNSREITPENRTSEVYDTDSDKREHVKDKYSSKAGMKIKFLDTVSNIPNASGEYDTIEVLSNVGSELQVNRDVTSKDTEITSKNTDQNLDGKVCLSNNETTNQDLLNVKDSVGGVMTVECLNSSFETDVGKSSTASMISLSDRLEHNASIVSTASSEGSVPEIPDSAKVHSIAETSEVEQNVVELTSGTISGKPDFVASSFHGNDIPSAGCHGNVPAPLADVPSEKMSTIFENKNTSSSASDLGQDIQQRIARLREKLIQIKRKRVAVQDKRMRVETSEEKRVCDDECLALDKECQETDKEISTLEQNLIEETSLCRPESCQ